MVLLLSDTVTVSLVVLEMLVILLVLKIKLTHKIKFRKSQPEDDITSLSVIDSTNVVKIARFLLDLESLPSDSIDPEKWQAYRSYLQDSLGDYLSSTPKLPNLSFIETTEYHLVGLITVVKSMLLLIAHRDQKRLAALLTTLIKMPVASSKRNLRLDILQVS